MTQLKRSGHRKHFGVRLTSAERELIALKARGAGLSQSEFIRRSVLNLAVTDRGDGRRQDHLLGMIANVMTALLHRVEAMGDEIDMLIITEHLRYLDREICQIVQLPAGSLHHAEGV